MQMNPDMSEASGDGRSSWLKLAFKLTLRAAIRPRLAVDLIALTWGFRAHDWYRKPPFLPLPPSDYLKWRMYTAYGDDRAVPPLEDVIRFARWRRKLPRS